jgi:phage shock protein PspC (stress-responsive transcriptional regulator)
MGTRLYRSRDDRMLAGVAGGLADLWDADPSLIRIVWALLIILTGGIALVAYIVMAIVVPEEDEVAPGRPFASTPPPAAGAPATEPGTADAGPGGIDWRTQRRIEQDERRAARQARRATRDPDSRTGAIVIGGLLVVIGGFFLVREYLPTIDFDWFWPAALVLLGVVVLLSALRPGRSGPGGS